MKTTNVYFSSITLAMKARRLLTHGGVKSRLIKRAGNVGTSGCTYGLSFNYTDEFTVISILKAAGTEYSFKNI